MVVVRGCVACNETMILRRIKKMLRLVFEIDTRNVTGVKEHLAMYLEKFGDTRLVEVRAVPDKTTQLRRESGK